MMVPDLTFLAGECERQIEVILDLRAERRAFRELLSVALDRLHRQHLELERLRRCLRARRREAA